jgi:hypothetical protein
MNEDLENRRIRAAEARQFMQNPLFKAMFEGVGESLEQRALSCPPTDKDMAGDIIRCKQLLVAMRREIERRAEDGDFAEFQMNELEQRRGIARIFRR